jgi:hypothetical protein
MTANVYGTRNQIPSPSDAGDAGLALRGLGGLLAAPGVYLTVHERSMAERKASRRNAGDDAKRREHDAA